MHVPFENRRDAGRKLARALQSYRSDETVVIGLPRGGVVLAFEVAQALGAPLDVIVARKIGAPDCPEFGIGSVAPGGIRYLDERVIRQLDISPEILDRLTRQARDEVVRRMELYRGSQRMPDLKGKIAILVDDGLATGVTARVAIQSARQAGAVRVILAIPVAPLDSVEMFQGIADEVVCLEQPEVFRAVGCWYADFDQTTDEEVLSLLRQAGGPPFGSMKSETTKPR